MNRKIDYKKTSLVFGLFAISAFALRTLVSNTQSVSAATPCIVTVFGKQYDVSPLQTGHPGGNIFICGTDMTATYQAQHGTNVSRLQPYLIVSPTSTPIPTAIPTNIPIPTITITPTIIPTVPTITPTVPPQVTPSPVIDPRPTSVDNRDEEEDSDDSHEDKIEDRDDHEEEKEDKEEGEDQNDRQENRDRDNKPRYKYQESHSD